MTLGKLIILPVALVALAAGPSCALADDAASTHAYLRANLALMRYANSHIPQAEKVLSGVVRRIGRECPRAAAESPQNADSTQLSNEVIGTMVTTVVRTSLHTGRSFVRTVTPLRWSNRALTRTIQAYASHVKVLLGLAVPDLCADVRAWTASGFKTLPAATVAFDRVFMPAWVGAGELPAALSRYESAGDRALARQAAKLESRWADFEAREVESWGAIMDALVLQP
ncbi:MAG TPA: hypothetical protein VFY36_10335 [Solirubrobacteraceae bacterium]|nr:hypothetical protein [Solirubrobacteraceae bacterium]